MSIATQAMTNELRQEFPVPLTTLLHFTSDVAGHSTFITIDLVLLTEVTEVAPKRGTAVRDKM